jgi:HEAT repeat protein
MQHLTRVVEIFRTQLQDDDSYVYLGAIRGFSALGDVEFETIVPLMRDLFLEYQIGEKKPKIEVISANAKNKSFTEFELTKRLEVRLKIGEAFLQIAQRLGEALPKYAATLVPIFLAGCRDPDPLVRASALSNLAELCELLHYALLPFLEEIVSCVQSLLQSDTTVEVRRGVINLYAQLLTGLEDEVFEVMPHHLHAIYSTLKHVQANDEDEVCRVHAEYAVNSLKHAVGQFVTPVEPDSALYRMLKIVK